MNQPAGDYDYDSRGDGYTKHRQPDPRFAAMIHARLDDAPSVVNVGAGAGSYEPNDRFVVAVEPSPTMRAQRPTNAAPVVSAIAQSLPFADDAFGASMAMSTIHQWADAAAGLRELRRVARGPVVIFTFAMEALEPFWLNDYVPEFAIKERKRVQPLEWVCEQLGGECTVEVLPIPADCTDGFVEAYYARPEMFLDESARRGQSAWAFLPAGVEDRAVAAIRSDLASGEWDRHYGHFRAMPSYRGSPTLVTSLPN